MPQFTTGEERQITVEITNSGNILSNAKWCWTFPMDGLLRSMERTSSTLKWVNLR